MIYLRVVLWFLDKIVGRHPRPTQTQEQDYGTLSQLYETPAVLKYLDDRERYLIDNGMERFIEGKLQDARGLSGQLIEVRAFRGRLSAAWAFTQRLRKERALATAKKTS